MRFLTGIFILLASIAFGQDISRYVPVADGTRLALDVYLPKEAEKSPVLVQFTRYWRSSENPETGAPNPSLGQLDRYFLSNGYAIVKVDVRGSGASFGTRPGEYTPQEVKDGYDIVEWIVAQPWALPAVGSYGTSYTGTTAELLTAVNHPAVKAVIPGWSDFDTYQSPVRPYGLLASSFIATWAQMVGAMDHNDASIMQANVRKVTEDKDGALLQAALLDHADNPDVFELTRAADFKDSNFGSFSFVQCAPLYWKKEIEASGVPMFVLASWMDAGTAEGALLRYQHFSNPQKVLLMATTHGGWAGASPYQVSNQITPPAPSVAEQNKMQLDFFDHHLKGVENGVATWPDIQYYTLGAELYQTSNQWPPAGSKLKPIYLGKNGSLTWNPGEPGSETYRVDFSVSTGKNNRWMAQMGQPIFNLHDRGEMDKAMLAFTSAPLESDLEITGTPIVELPFSTTTSDGAVFVYLEVVDEDGQSRYITEGGLRLIHRKVTENPVFDEVAYHSFLEQDAEKVQPGKMETLQFKLWPTSVVVRKGESIRIAIAGADAGTFDRLPMEGSPVYTISYGPENPAFISLPIITK